MNSLGLMIYRMAKRVEIATSHVELDEGAITPNSVICFVCKNKFGVFFPTFLTFYPQEATHLSLVKIRNKEHEKQEIRGVLLWLQHFQGATQET